MNQATPIRRRRKEERPGQLLDAALLLFAEKGYGATRVEEIASRAGVSKGTLFLYYPSKEKLFEAVIQHTTTVVLQDIQTFAAHSANPAAATVPTASERVRELLKIWWQRYARTSARTIPRLILTEAHHFPASAAFYEKQVVAPYRHLMKSIIQQGIDQGEFRAMDINHAWLSIHTLLVYFSIWGENWYGKRSGNAIDVETFIEHQTEVLIRGFSP